jgi:hypothetical protein
LKESLTSSTNPLLCLTTIRYLPTPVLVMITLQDGVSPKIR